MIMKNNFYDQVSLLLKCLPIINNEKKFVLTGGTAINLFLQDMPRFSVDIDLILNSVSNRKTALNEIHQSLTSIEEKLLRQPGINKIIPQKKDNQYYKLNVFSHKNAIKIEVSDVGRGCFLPTEQRDLCDSACKMFETTMSINLAPYNEIYAGKVRAALDRQHPRDLFDVKILLEDNGISDDLMDCIVVYLIQGNRPFHEFLEPNRLDRKSIFLNEFVGMTKNEVVFEDLLKTREQLILLVNEKLTNKHKFFVYSFYGADQPNWDLIPIQNIKEMPAIKWKLRNIEIMGKKNKDLYAEKLKKLFSIS